MVDLVKSDDPNKAVTEFLHHYCNPESQFDYSCMGGNPSSMNQFSVDTLSRVK
jgi:hypothetical protein